MERDIDLTKKVQDYCYKIGANIVGFADPIHFNKFSKDHQPEQFLKGSKTVVILGLYLYDIILDSWNRDPDTGKQYHFADSILTNFCARLTRFLSNEGYDSKIVSYEPGLFLKDACALAGIGPIGKNNLLITEEFGSQVRLRAIATSAPLVCRNPILKSKYCEGCNKCIEACPSNALLDGKYKKELCLPYCLSHLRILSKDTVIWCNVCIDACPIGKIKEIKH